MNINQSPKGIKWSAVPLPCSTFLSFHGGKQGSSLNKGQSPVEWGDFPYVCSFVLGWASDLTGWASGLAGWASGLAGILQDFVPYWGRCPKNGFASALEMLRLSTDGIFIQEVEVGKINPPSPLAY